MSKYNKGESQKTTPLKDQTLAEIIDELFEMGVLTGRGKANIDVAGAKRIATKHIRAYYAKEIKECMPEKEYVNPESTEPDFYSSNEGFNQAICEMEDNLKAKGLL